MGTKISTVVTIVLLFGALILNGNQKPPVKQGLPKKVIDTIVSIHTLIDDNLSYYIGQDFSMLENNYRHIQFDSAIFLNRFEYHRDILLKPDEPHFDFYIDSLETNKENIYFKRYSSPEDYAIMITSVLFGQDARTRLDLGIMLYLFPNKIYSINAYASLLGEEFVHYVNVDLFCACAFTVRVISYSDTSTNKRFFQMAFPYFYNFSIENQNLNLDDLLNY